MYSKIIIYSQQHAASYRQRVIIIIYGHRFVKRPKNNTKRYQTRLLRKEITNVDILKTVCKLRIEYYCSSCKFEIPVRSCGSQRNSFPNSYYNINLRESLVVSFFYISCDVYYNNRRWQKQTRLFKKWVNFANLYYIHDYRLFSVVQLDKR